MEAKAETIVGSGTTSGILILTWAHDVIPFISEIGIIMGTILAIHGVYELIRKKYMDYKARKHNQ